MLLVFSAFARDIDVKVHDRDGTVTGPVEVELVGPGGKAAFTCKDDGVAPDAVAGDHMYTAKAENLTVENGNVTVRAAGRTWQGGFGFDPQSDPVLLVGLEANGLAAASTHEVMFVPDAPITKGPQAPAGEPPPPPSQPHARTGLPEGMALGWVVGAVALGGLGALGYAGSRRPPRIPPLRGPVRPTSATRGPWVPGASDLFVGPAPAGGDGVEIGEGRWTPEEIGIAALRARCGRVVVTAPHQVEAAGDAYGALSSALAGIADLLWSEGDRPASSRSG